MVYSAWHILGSIPLAATSAQLLAPVVAGSTRLVVIAVTAGFTGTLGTPLYSDLRAATETSGKSKIATVFE